jgi:hypothetical protein
MLLNVENFALVLRVYNSKLLKGCFDALINPRIKEIIKDIIGTLVVDEGPQNLNKVKDKICYIVRDESSVALNLARIVHTQLTADAFVILNEIERKMNSKSIKLIKQDNKGYYFSIGAEVIRKYDLQKIEQIIGEQFIQTIKVIFSQGLNLREEEVILSKPRILNL